MKMIVAGVLLAQVSTGYIVARVKEVDLRIHDLTAAAHLEVWSKGQHFERTFRLSMLRDGVNYRALIELDEPKSMAGTRFLIRAERGKRNQEWAYFPDLDLVREIHGKQQDDPFLGSDITYADLAGGAHLDDLRHVLVGEETVDGERCWVLEGTPRHRTAYGKLRGWVRQSDFVIVQAEFFDPDGAVLKRARLLDVRELGDDIRLAHRIEVESASGDSRSVLTFADVVVNEGFSPDAFTVEALDGAPR